MEPVVDSEQDIGDVRNEIDVKHLERLCALKNMPPGVVLGPNFDWCPFESPFTVKQFNFGQSNPTYLIKDSKGRKAVLRKKPTSNSKLVSKTAHAVEREFYLLSALNSINLSKEGKDKLPVASVYFLCEDEAHLGAVFYMMQFVKGRIFHDPSFSNVEPKQERFQLWSSAVKVASQIHSIPADQLFDKLPEKYFHKPSKKPGSSFFQRQVRTLSKIQQSQAKTVEDIPHFQEIAEWLFQNSPEDPEIPTLIHGDFKIDNLVFDLKEPKVVAVLDWELCTNGHPLFDLANLLQPFIFPPKMNEIFSKFSIEPNKEHINKILNLYTYINNPKWNAQKLWKVGTVFGLFRISVISQGIAQRVVEGVASSAEAKQVGSLYPYVGELAYDMIRPETKL